MVFNLAGFWAERYPGKPVPTEQMLNHLGISYDTWYRIIKGKQLPNLSLAYRMAEMLDTTLDHLIVDPLTSHAPIKVDPSRFVNA